MCFFVAFPLVFLCSTWGCPVWGSILFWGCFPCCFVFCPFRFGASVACSLRSLLCFPCSLWPGSSAPLLCSWCFLPGGSCAWCCALCSLRASLVLLLFGGSARALAVGCVCRWLLFRLCVLLVPCSLCARLSFVGGWVLCCGCGCGRALPALPTLTQQTKVKKENKK